MARSDRHLVHGITIDSPPGQKAASDALRDWIKSEIAVAVGMDVRNVFDLTTTDGKAFALLFYLVGAVDIEDFTIRPLDEWLF